MLHILAWLAVLVAALFALGEVIRPWRKRRWFKLAHVDGEPIPVSDRDEAGIVYE